MNWYGHSGQIGRKVVLKQILHLGWNRCGFDGFRRFSVRQLHGERACVQRETVKRIIPPQVVYGPHRAVTCIADNRMAGQFCVSSYLMRAAGQKLYFYQRVMGAVINNLITGLARLSASSAFGMMASASGFGKGPAPCSPRNVIFRFFKSAMQNCSILLFYQTGFKLIRKESKHLPVYGQ